MTNLTTEELKQLLGQRNELEKNRTQGNWLAGMWLSGDREGDYYIYLSPKTTTEVTIPIIHLEDDAKYISFCANHDKDIIAKQQEIIERLRGALEEVSEEMELRLASEGVCMQGDSGSHKVDADSYGATSLLIRSKESLQQTEEV